MIRIGQGIDIHAFKDGQNLVIAGVKIPFEKSFKAHSDGDIVVHALCDALLGAMSLKDIGTYFPDNSKEWKNADSLNVILPKVFELVNKDSFTINNIDINIVIEKPKLMPYIDEMKNNLSKALKISIDQIAIKAKRTEMCIFLPPFEGAMAIVSTILSKN